MKENNKVSLFINSATKALQIGILVGDEKERIDLPDPKKALETMHKGMASLFEKTGTSLAEVDAFYLLLGPGSNTGIRLGLTIPRTVYAFNPKVELYGIPTMNLFTLVKPHAALSDRNGNLYFGTRNGSVSSFERIDKDRIASLEKMDIAVEEKDMLAREELKNQNISTFDVLDLMMEEKEKFTDFSAKEDEYLPEYLLKI